MTAADAKFSLEWQLWPEVYSWGKTYMSNVVGYEDVVGGKTRELAGVTVVDDYTIQVTLTKPQAVFPGLLSFSMNGIIPKEETIAAGKDFGTKVIIGTGPFKFVEWIPGQRAVFERHPQYFREGLPYLDRIELFLKVEPSVQMLRWENNEIEVARNIPPAELARVLNDAKFQPHLRKTPSVGTNKLMLNFKTRPLDNLKVRQAVAHAIDKQAIVRKLGGAAVALEGYYAEGMLQFDKNFKSAYQYDPKKAKALLAEAGFANGIKGVKQYVGSTAGDVPQMIQADLKAVGIETEFAVGARKEWRDRIRAGEVGIIHHGWSASFYDAYDFVSIYTSCASITTGDNDMNYCNSRIDELMEQAEKLPLADPKRIAAYREIEDIVINRDVAMIGLYQSLGLLLSKNYVQDDFPSGIYGGWPYIEQAWIDK
jgi:ABC-type transport system substrate-binding protein